MNEYLSNYEYKLYYDIVLTSTIGIYLKECIFSKVGDIINFNAIINLNSENKEISGYIIEQNNKFEICIKHKEYIIFELIEFKEGKMVNLGNKKEEKGRAKVYENKKY